MENKAAFEIQGSAKSLREKDGKIYETKSDPFIKFNVNFRKDWLAKLKGAKLSVFICLALHIDEERISYPSIDTIMAETELSNRAIINVIRELEKMKIVEVIRERGKVNRYKLAPVVSFGEKPVHIGPVNLVHTTSGGNNRTSELNDTRTSELLSHQSSLKEEPKEEPVEEEPVKKESSAKTADNGRPPKDEFNRIRKVGEDTFYEITGSVRFTSPKTMNKRVWTPLIEMADLVEWREDDLVALLYACNDRMKDLTYDAPDQWMKTARSIIREARMGTYKPKYSFQAEMNKFLEGSRDGK